MNGVTVEVFMDSASKKWQAEYRVDGYVVAHTQPIFDSSAEAMDSATMDIMLRKCKALGLPKSEMQLLKLEAGPAQVRS